MWIVRLALRRPYTVLVSVLAVLLFSGLALQRLRRDILPNIDIPVVNVIWNFPGLSADDMEKRVVFITERAVSTTVGDIERIESQSLLGIGLVRVYFQEGVDVGAAIAQINAVCNTILRILPPGITPPNILQYNASNVQVAQLTVKSDSVSEQELFDYGLNFLRLRLFTIKGLSTPAPFGGRTREIVADLEPRKMQAHGVSAEDVVTALTNNNVILPAGQARIGGTEYDVLMNSSPLTVEEFDAMPLKVENGMTVLLGDVAHVHDGYAVQSNIVHVNGRRATYLSILRKVGASTLTVVDAVKKLLPSIRAAAPKGTELSIDFDQSVFVRAAISSVLREAGIAAVLVSLMILGFLGSWRLVVIVCTSIPIALLFGIIGLFLTGQTLNLMTLGGLALAVGMLVDDATVEVENIHRNRLMGKPLTRAILDGAHQIAVPAIVATLSICIVFSPVVLLVGPARFLFTPLAISVVLAMLASYVLSRTLVPALARLLMRSEEHHAPSSAGPTGGWKRVAFRFNSWRDAKFERFQNGYASLLHTALDHRRFTIFAAGAVALASLGLVFVVGTDFFPSVDAGLMKLHFRAPNGSRIEKTEALVTRVEDGIREIIPPREIETINSMLGIPISYNLAFVQTDNVSAMDAEILIALKPDHAPTARYMQAIRKMLKRDFPGSSAYFQPADIVSQVLNFGLSAPIDVQVEFPDLQKGYQIARKLRDGIAEIAGTTDAHIVQDIDYPALNVDVDRLRAAQAGLSERDVANNLLVSLSSSGLVAPSYFLTPHNNVNYTVVVKTPLPQLASVEGVMSTPLTAGAPLETSGGAASPAALPEAPTQILSGIASVRPGSSPEQINHYTVQRVIDVDANVEDRDLGSVATEIQRKIDGLGKLAPGMKVTLRGQNQVMQQSFRSLGLGLILAALLVYCLMVILFQSWLDPLIIMVAVPGALVGILWMLAFTHTTINVESLMGSIMAVGIAVSNSILLVSFANDLRVEKEGISPLEAALEAGRTRLRPVIMTALAMIIGMIPMALGLGEAGEQNAPLGRAVIGGLALATVTTLFLVPVVYASLRVKLPNKHVMEQKFLDEEKEGEGPHAHPSGIPA
jgi:multidrug efflux pump subunit AcrB